MSERLGQILDRAIDFPTSPMEWRAALEDLINECAATLTRRGKTLFLIVDGLDEDEGDDVARGIPSIAATLPVGYPENGNEYKVFVTSRHYPDLPIDVPRDHPLRECQHYFFRPSPHAKDVQRLAERELNRALQGGLAEVDVVGVLAASGGGLSTSDLSDIAMIRENRIRAVLRTSLSRSVTYRSSPGASDAADNSLGFAHKALGEIASALLGRDLHYYQALLFAWADRYRVEHRWPPNTPTYLLIPFWRLLVRLNHLDTLILLALDSARHARLSAITGSDARALTEIEELHGLLAGVKTSSALRFFQLAYTRDRLRALNSSIPPRLPALLAQLGRNKQAVALFSVISKKETAAEAAAYLIQVPSIGDKHIYRDLTKLAIKHLPQWNQNNARRRVLEVVVRERLTDEALDWITALDVRNQIKWIGSLADVVGEVDGLDAAADVLSAGLDFLAWHSRDFDWPRLKYYWPEWQQLVLALLSRRARRGQIEARKLEKAALSLPTVEQGYSTFHNPQPPSHPRADALRSLADGYLKAGLLDECLRVRAHNDFPFDSELDVRLALALIRARSPQADRFYENLLARVEHAAGSWQAHSIIELLPVVAAHDGEPGIRDICRKLRDMVSAEPRAWLSRPLLNAAAVLEFFDNTEAEALRHLAEQVVLAHTREDETDFLITSRPSSKDAGLQALAYDSAARGDHERAASYLQALASSGGPFDRRKRQIEILIKIVCDLGWYDPAYLRYADELLVAFAQEASQSYSPFHLETSLDDSENVSRDEFLEFQSPLPQYFREFVNALIALGRYDTAERAIRSVCSAEGKVAHLLTLARMAVSCEPLRSVRLAEEALRDVRNSTSDHEQQWFLANLAQATAELDKLDLAVGLAERIEPAHARRVYIDLADTAWKAGRTELFELCIQRAIAMINTDSPSIGREHEQFLIVELLSKSGRLELAVAQQRLAVPPYSDRHSSHRLHEMRSSIIHGYCEAGKFVEALTMIPAVKNGRARKAAWRSIAMGYCAQRLWADLSSLIEHNAEIRGDQSIVCAVVVKAVELENYTFVQGALGILPLSYVRVRSLCSVIRTARDRGSDEPAWVLQTAVDEISHLRSLWEKSMALVHLIDAVGSRRRNVSDRKRWIDSALQLAAQLPTQWQREKVFGEVACRLDLPSETNELGAILQSIQSVSVKFEILYGLPCRTAEEAQVLLPEVRKIDTDWLFDKFRSGWESFDWVASTRSVRNLAIRMVLRVGLIEEGLRLARRDPGGPDAIAEHLCLVAGAYALDSPDRASNLVSEALGLIRPSVGSDSHLSSYRYGKLIKAVASPLYYRHDEVAAWDLCRPILVEALAGAQALDRLYSLEKFDPSTVVDLALWLLRDGE